MRKKIKKRITILIDNLNVIVILPVTYHRSIFHIELLSSFINFQEVINLTSELETKSSSAKPDEPAPAQSAPSYDDEDEDAPFYRAAAGTNLAVAEPTGREWKIGDKCMANWSEDSM